ncbi:MAG: TraR/DksA C4-type zinc finger protein [Bacteroidia bacterium]|nr:TraR/DksA C4-type zinc finger protein [Bacteroidia bacterium]
MDPRKELEKAVEKTISKIERYEAIAGPIAPDNAIGRVSRMDAINNKSVVDAALRKAKERLAGLKRHLDLLGRPEFGLCSKCKSEIPFERILLAPESSFCVTCAP